MRSRQSSQGGDATGSGAGMGLSIALALAESNGGTIRVASIAGEGTDFTVELPLDSEILAP